MPLWTQIACLYLLAGAAVVWLNKDLIEHHLDRAGVPVSLVLDQHDLRVGIGQVGSLERGLFPIGHRGSNPGRG